MGCHIAIATGEPAIQKLTAYSEAGEPIPWVRVYTVQSDVTWTHGKHIRAGLKCESCHGPVGQLAAMQQLSAVTSMASCIGCHQKRHVSTECTTCHSWPKKAGRGPQIHVFQCAFMALESPSSFPLTIRADSTQK
jgi:hypothetical protein